MKKLLNIRGFYLLFFLIIPFSLFSQIGVNKTNSDPDPSAMLDVQSAKKGFLMPRMTTQERDSISNPATGLMIYNVDDSCFNYYSGQEWVKDCGRSIADDIVELDPSGNGGTLNDQGLFIDLDANGNYYVSGIFSGTGTFGKTSLTSLGNKDVFVIKYAPSGEAIWAFSYGSTDSDPITDMKVDAQGNIYLTGEYSAPLQLGDTILPAGNNRIYAAKFNTLGQLELAFNSTGSNLVYPGKILPDYLGNFYLSGSLPFGASLAGISFSEAFLIKFDGNGQILWSTSYNANRGANMALDSQGDLILAGGNINSATLTFNNPNPLSLSGANNYIGKLLSNGQLSWLLPGGSSDPAFVQLDADDNIYLGGVFLLIPYTLGSITIPNPGFVAAFVAKLDPNGVPLWAVANAGSGNAELRGGMTTDQAGNTTLQGKFTGTISFGNDTLVSAGSEDIAVVRVDKDGNFLWAQRTGSTGSDMGEGVALNQFNDIYLTGGFSGTVDFGSNTLSAQGQSDLYVWFLEPEDGQNLVVENSSLAASQDGDSDATNELQNLSLNGSMLNIDNGIGVDLTNILAGSDDQALSINGDTLSIEDGNSVILNSLVDNLGDHQATQNISLDSFFLSSDGDDEGLLISNNGSIAIGDNGLNFADSSAIVDVQSANKGFLMPRLTTNERDAIVSPAPGLMIYNLDDSCFNYFSGKDWVKDCGRDLNRDSGNFLPFQVGGASNEEANSIDTDADGNYYVVGHFNGSTIIGTDTLISNGGEDGFIVKFSPQGKALWVISVGAGGADNVLDIKVDSAGNSTITGYYTSQVTFGSINLNSIGARDIFVVEIDPSGQVIWAKSFGGNGNDTGYAIDIDDTGNSYITGNFTSTATFENTTITSSGPEDAFISKIGSNGQLIWVKKGGGLEFDAGRDVSVDLNGNVYATGFIDGTATFDGVTLSNNGEEDIFVVKYNPTGQLLWAKSYGGIGDDQGWGIQNDPLGNIILTGTFEFNIGFGAFSLGNPSRNAFLLKLTSTGSEVWAKGIYGELRPNSIDLDYKNNIFLTGYFEGAVDVLGTNISGQNAKDIFVTKIDSTGQLLWINEAKNSSFFDNFGNGICADLNGNCFVTGYFSNTLSIGGGSLTSEGQRDFFVWSLGSNSGENMVLTHSSLSLSQDGDTDPSNEWQSLSLNGTQLSISDGNTVDLTSIDTDDQTLSLSTTQLSITDGNTIDLGSIDTDNQTLSLSGAQLSILDGNTVDLASIDTDDQTLSLSGSQLSILDGNTVDLVSIDTDDQTLSLSGTQLSISDGNTVDLTSIATATNAQTLTLNGTQLSITDGDTVDLISIQDNLGNHFATENIQLDTFYLSGDGDDEGLFIDDNGRVGIGTSSPDQPLTVQASGTSAAADLLSFKDVGTIPLWEFNLRDNGFNIEETGINSRLFIEQGGKIGLGTTSPDNHLHIADSIQGGGDTTGIKLTNGTINSLIYQEGTDLIIQKDNQANQLVLDESGDIGIGMNDPSNKLDVAGKIRLTTRAPQIMFDYPNRGQAGYESRISYIDVNLNGYTDINTGNTIFPAIEDQRIDFHVSNNTPTGTNNVMSLVGNGRVGIGTTSPSDILHAINDGSIRIRAESTTSDFAGFLSRNADMNIFSGIFNNKYVIYQNGVNKTRMAIDQNGYVGINTTNPITFLHVTGTGPSASGTGNYFIRSSPSNIYTTFSRPNVVAYFEGDIIATEGIASMSVNTWSDARAKQIIARSNSATDLDLLNQIQITDYRWIDTREDQGRIHKKIIAQEVEEILPNAVSRMRKAIPNVYQQASEVIYDSLMGHLTLVVDKEHSFEVGDKVRVFTDTEDLEEVELLAVLTSNSFTIKAKPASQAFVYGKWVDDYRMVDYDALSMLNISATQEQQKMIEELKATVKKLEAENLMLRTNLEGRLEALEAKIDRENESAQK